VTPQRTCIGCRRVAPSDQLVRVVRTAVGELQVGRHHPGRGAWLCPGTACVALAARRKGFARALRGPVTATAVALLSSSMDTEEVESRP